MDMKELLTPTVQERLARIKNNPEIFTPNQFVANELAKKSLVMMIGPCASGKSYLIDQLVIGDRSFRKSRSFTSRPPRSDDTPETIRYIDWTGQGINDFCQTIEQGDFVNFTFHPKTGEIYGTALPDHPGTYNLMPTMATSVAALKTLPFRHTTTVGLATNPEQWQHWFDTRELTSDTDRAARIGEGIISLQWLLEHPGASIVSNTPSIDAVGAIQRIVKTNTVERDEKAAEALLDYLHLIS